MELNRLVLLLFCPLLAQATSEIAIEKVAHSKAWLRLMHYLPHWGGYKSELDGKEFFFAPNGKYDPVAELKASLAGLQGSKPIGEYKLPPQCAFPFRKRFLETTFGVRFPNPDCKLFKQFMERFNDPLGVTLVFSSAYPNNPASMFGHTFLKIESARKNHLLDQGVNYAAYTPPNANLLAFMYLGVTGGYRGRWSTDPYYKKVNEYVNAESRDLWEYELNLTKEETLRLLEHLWELEISSHFDYYFFDENCSYQIVRALEAIKPEWDFAHQHSIYVIPGETIKWLSERKEIVKDVRFRPSLYHQLERRYLSLTSKERARARRLAHGKEAPNPTPEELDAALLMLLYEKAKKKLKWSEADQARENLVLNWRHKNSRPAQPLDNPPIYLRSRPDRGHDPYSFHLGGGWLENSSKGEGAMGRLKLRTAYHDLMANDEGFAPFSEIDFPWIDFQFHEDQFRIHELGVISTTSLFPLTSFDRRLSWRIRWAMETDRGLECGNCLLNTFETAGGFALGSSTSRFYVFGLLRGEAHPRLALGYRLPVGVESGALFQLAPKFKSRLAGRALWNVAEEKRMKHSQELRWDHSYSLSRQQEIRQVSLVHYNDLAAEPTWLEFRIEWIQYFR